MSKELIHAVHPKDVLSFFATHNLLGELEAGKIRCAMCQDTISLENFRAVTRLRGKLLFACNKDSCGFALMDREESAESVDVSKRAKSGGIR